MSSKSWYKYPVKILKYNVEILIIIYRSKHFLLCQIQFCLPNKTFLIGISHVIDSPHPFTSDQTVICKICQTMMTFSSMFAKYNSAYQNLSSDQKEKATCDAASEGNLECLKFCVEQGFFKHDILCRSKWSSGMFEILRRTRIS
jgi:hypothetical protein